MDEQQKERLEQELKFLKESLEADVISKDEYEKGRERIERKIKELEESKEETPYKVEKKIEKAEEKEEIKEEQKIQDFPASKSKGFEEPKIEIKEIKEKPTKIIGDEEEKPEEPEEETEEKPEEEEKEPVAEEKEPEEEPEEEIKVSKKWIYGMAILIIAVILSFSIRSCSRQEETPLAEEFTPECSSDSDCKQQGMVGTCISPGTKEAECEFKKDIETNLIVINSKDCNLCDASNTKTFIRELFPNVNIKEIDYETEEAQKLVNELGVDALPAYIFDSNVSKAINFNDFKTALIKRKDSYIITNTASGASYYFKRSLIKNRLDVYLLPQKTEKIESNIEEVSNLFKDKLNITTHTVTEMQKESLKKELAINTYPAFLLNNQIKFRGILPADMIKENICRVNYFEECNIELSKI